MNDLIDATVCLLGSQTFWTAIGAIGSFLVAFIALYPIWQKAKLGKAMFEHAVQIFISPDGILTVHNIFDQPIIINHFKQLLIAGSEIGLNKSSEISEIENKINNLKLSNFDNVKTIMENKPLAPNLQFILSGSATFLHGTLEDEPIWVVDSQIQYSSTKGREKTVILRHRISKILNPTNQWIELI